jgi:hypothetical protein
METVGKEGILYCPLTSFTIKSGAYFAKSTALSSQNLLLCCGRVALPVVSLF